MLTRCTQSVTGQDDDDDDFFFFNFFLLEPDLSSSSTTAEAAADKGTTNVAAVGEDSADLSSGLKQIGATCTRGSSTMMRVAGSWAVVRCRRSSDDG